MKGRHTTYIYELNIIQDNRNFTALYIDNIENIIQENSKNLGIIEDITQDNFRNFTAIQNIIQDNYKNLATIEDIIQDNLRNFTALNISRPEYLDTTGPVSCHYWRASLGK